MTVLRCACGATVASAQRSGSRLEIRVAAAIESRTGLLTWTGLSQTPQRFDCRRCRHVSRWTIDQLVDASQAGRQRVLVGTAMYGLSARGGMQRWRVESSRSSPGSSRLVISTLASTA